MKISVVIICKDGSKHLAETILSARGLADEILLYDSGSSDDSIQIAELFAIKVYKATWEGYGKNRYKAALLAKNDWILMLDTDEVLDEELSAAIRQIDLGKNNIGYKFRYRNFFGGKLMKHGEWGNDWHIRMANRRSVQLETEIVHEKLFLQPGLVIQELPGNVLHYTADSCISFARKMTDYASLSADKYHGGGKSASWYKLFFSPFFSFVQNYFFKLGFLDGWQGFVCAMTNSWYTFLKYARLRELDREHKPLTVTGEKKITEAVQNVGIIAR